MHRHKRKGVRSLHLKEDGVTGLSKFDSDRADFKKWDITAKNVQLPNDDHTHYYCQVLSSSNKKTCSNKDTPTKVYAIGESVLSSTLESGSSSVD